MKPKTLLSRFLELGAFLVSKQLITLALALRSSRRLALRQFVSVVASSMTWLTWTPGLSSISPEGGP